jgi:hypothetical protein
MSVGRIPQQGQGVGQPDFFWLRGLAGGNNRFHQSVAAFAGGGQAGGTVIGATNAQGTEAELVEIQTVVSANDSCQLPQAIKGKVLKVFNSSANSSNIYASPSVNKATGVTDTINGASNVTAYALAGGVSAEFFCPRDGIWAAIKSA